MLKLRICSFVYSKMVIIAAVDITKLVIQLDFAQ